MTVRLIVLLFFFATIGAGFSQDKREVIEKGDNAFFIHTNTPLDSAFLICSKYLAGVGYSFHTRDASLGQIVTDEKSYAGAFSYKLNIVFQDKQIIVHASIQLMTLGGQFAWTDWKYAKNRGNMHNDAYVKFYPDIQQVASKLKGSKILYGKT